MERPVDVLAALEGVTAHWSPRVVGRVNDQYVKVAKLLTTKRTGDVQTARTRSAAEQTQP